MSKRIIVGITGASGVIYGIRLLQALKKIGSHEIHLILSPSGKKNIEIETDFQPADIEALADVCHDFQDMTAGPASGSFLVDGMIISPCTIKTLSGIANSFNDNLLIRTADVQLKERRKLVLAVRETPLHLGHLRLMTAVTEMGANIIPPIPAFYHRPKSIDDIVIQHVGKILDFFGIRHDLFDRWGRDS